MYVIQKSHKPLLLNFYILDCLYIFVMQWSKTITVWIEIWCLIFSIDKACTCVYGIKNQLTLASTHQIKICGGKALIHSKT